MVVQIPSQIWLGALHTQLSPEEVKPFVQLKPQGLPLTHCGTELSGYVHGV
jgi:hypothetical protein